MSSNPSAPNVAIGELLWDLIPSGPRLGGATTNFAVLSARLGQAAVLISRVGNDPFGNDALTQLQSLAASPANPTPLDLSSIQLSTTLPTGTVSVTLDPTGRPEYLINSPVAWDEITLNPTIQSLAASASVLYFGTLTQRLEPSRTTLRTLIQSASPASIRVCDLNLRLPFCTPETLLWSLTHADVLKVSDEELPAVARLLNQPTLAEAFSSISPSDSALTHAASAAAKSLLALAPHCQLVAITLGPHGSLLANRSDSHRHPGFHVKVADTIGAGDAFTAGLVHAHLHHASLPKISEVANLCGSFVASQPGATPQLPPALLQQIAAALS